MITVCVRLPNWIGDTLMALPALQQLASRSDVQMRLFGRAWAQELLAAYAWPVSELPRGLRAGAACMAGARADLGLLLTHSLSSALMMRWAGIACIGYRRDLRRWLLRRSLPWPTGIHEAQRYWRIARLMQEYLDQRAGGGAQAKPWPEHPPAVRLRLSSDHRNRAAAALAAAGVTGAYAVICPLATGLVQGKPKQWPGFPELTRKLLSGGQRLVAVAPPGRRADMLAAVPGAVILDGLPAGVFAGVLAGAQQVIANDSGPMHLAAAVGCDTIGIFGVSDPARTGAWGGRFSPVGGPDGWPTPEQVWDSLRKCSEITQ